MASSEPLSVSFHAHQRPNVLFQVDVPARSVRVLLAGFTGLDGIQIGAGPKSVGQSGETKAGVELFGSFNDPLRRFVFEALVQIGGFDQAGPVLAPTVVD